MNPREKLKLPSGSNISARSYRAVDIVHPVCDRPLFSLPAFSESIPPANTVYGVDRQLVLDACRIITNYTSEDQADYHALDRAGQQSASTENALLEPGRYYYILSPSDTTTNYRIVADFRAWDFPERVLPHWSWPRDNEETVELQVRYANVSSTAVSDVVKWDDGHCLITHYLNGASFSSCETAHLVPQDQKNWLAANGMNVITLRRDVRYCLEGHVFVFCPVDHHTFLTYVLREGVPDYAELLHRRPVTFPRRVPAEFIYARFAYTVISLLQSSPYFDDFPIPDAVKLAEKTRASGQKRNMPSRKQKEPKLDTVDEGDNKTSTSSKSTQSESEEDVAARNERWKAQFATWFPTLAKLEEVEHPPETSWVGLHPETPHALRLMWGYIQKNPLVWQTSTTPADATRPDDEGYLAKMLSR
ncbi:hypothetical protein BD311DRAFT_670717 [Dichomitus squalens]|uniref:HNH nuclease domain-containing protein n=1 Tax=Dichomitus squalens TaxID=114155 RepID=A0A4Q9MCC1_9APHY|nr:hypothetical protein BD311DRAFT_670717 [Dichomitus squalens]